MKRRIFAAVLSAAMVLSLAACGGGNGSASSNPGSGSDVSTVAPGGSSSQPDASIPSGGSASGGASSAEGLEVTLTLSRDQITLEKAGAIFKLRYTAQPDTDGIPSFTSSDEKVATVDNSGYITAVAPGKATITVTYDGATAACAVTCDWKVSEPAPKPEQKPEPKPDPKPDASKPGSGSSSGSSSSSSSSSKVDLQAFYDDTTGKYQFASMMVADDTALTNFFAGLSDLNLSQRLVNLCAMMPAPNGDFVLIQVSDSKDVDTVKGILQARIDYMVGDGNGPGGAWYPGPTEQWQNNSRVVSNGNYVMMIVHENCDDIVNDFNALF